MISIQEADQILQREILHGALEELPLAQCTGRVLRESILAERDAPPYDRAMMDGYAFRSTDLDYASGTLPVLGKQSAGQAPQFLAESAGAYEIMTGAMVPANADAVVPYEEVERLENGIRIARSAAVKGRFIDYQGSNHKAASVVLPEGTTLQAPELAVAATEGCLSLRVNASLSIHLITTGDEVVSVSEVPEAWQIRGSHAAALGSLLSASDLIFSSEHVPDNLGLLEKAIQKALNNDAWLVICGGVSKGEKDYVIEALNQIGAKIHFHRVAQRPGHPMAFASYRGLAIFCLPGNPLSVLCSARRHLIPAIHRSRGARGAKFSIPLQISESISASPDSTRFIPVKLSGTTVSLLPFRNSGSLHSLSGSTGFIEIPPAQESYPSGTQFAYFPWSF